MFKDEAAFESALIETMMANGNWQEVLENPTEEVLIQNWANIIYENNRDYDRLGDHPLSVPEIKQIMEKVNALESSCQANEFINTREIQIERDHPQSSNNGKPVSLRLFDRAEINAGATKYQIAQQPIFKRSDVFGRDRRGDVMLLINGMPVIHIELKRSGVDVDEAVDQIRKYSANNIFRGLFNLIQVFVAMTPEETKYFANPGPTGKFNTQYMFHWADFYNKPVNDWKAVADQLLSIPMAHEMIGYYTVADKRDNTLKVMRSYQYWQASRIRNKVANRLGHWEEDKPRLGYIHSATGSGKSLTSFKVAQLLYTLGYVDKVLLVVDRIELGDQTLKNYNGFSLDTDGVDDTASTAKLVQKLMPDDAAEIIVTSINKMSRVTEENGISHKTLEKINSQRIAIIIDEAHRSVFSDMMLSLRNTFSSAAIFGLTGTPIFEENAKHGTTTVDVFGEELHRYTMAHAIQDGNVLGFDLTGMSTFNAEELREIVALDKAKAQSIEEVYDDKKKTEVFQLWMDKDKKSDANIEDQIKSIQYDDPKHREVVVDDIISGFMTRSAGRRYHAIFATHSIPEAVEYYKLFKQKTNNLRVTCVFDPSDGKGEFSIIKEGAIKDILKDYHEMFGPKYSVGEYRSFKSDVMDRLAHDNEYKNLHLPENKNKKLDIVIVVDQMLTGYDSKWVNTLYLDKVLEFERLIQAFSRTNRLESTMKPNGIIRYYRKPATMKLNINGLRDENGNLIKKGAIDLYSAPGLKLFVDHLPDNIRSINALFEEISELFKANRIENFEKLPESKNAQKMFGKLFRKMDEKISAAQLQGMEWNQDTYSDGNEEVKLIFDEQTYLTLVERFKEIYREGGDDGPDPVPYDIAAHLYHSGSLVINARYLNETFDIYVKKIREGCTEEEKETLLQALHKNYAYLPKKRKAAADRIFTDIAAGTFKLEADKNLEDYINTLLKDDEEAEYQAFKDLFDIDIEQLRKLKNTNLTVKNLNLNRRFDKLKDSVDKDMARKYFEEKLKRTITIPEMNRKLDEILKMYLLKDKFDL